MNDRLNQNGLYSNQIPFTTVVPSISDVSPASGTGGNQVTITGSNFGATQGSSTILFNGALTNAATWSDSSIAATVSAYATTGSAVVIVNGVPSNAVPFATSPTISSLTPVLALAGTVVTISGSNFGQTPGTGTVTFNGMPASPTSWSATSITVPVPAGALSGPVIVTVDGATSNLVNFTVGQSGESDVCMEQRGLPASSDSRVATRTGPLPHLNASKIVPVYKLSAGNLQVECKM
jgi:IPT/TIG domain